MRVPLACLFLSCLAPRPGAPDGEASLGAAPSELVVRGVTISCQTNGREWGSDGFGAELDRLAALGVNWVAIHPYAWISGDGTVRWHSIDALDPPRHVARPIHEAHARGLSILIKPHLGYWGSPFSWRGAIDFEDPDARARFFRTYRAWIAELCQAARDADAFCIGTELDRLAEPRDAPRWREIAADCRARTRAHLTYAANWSDYADVPFWDALDAIGIQAYFPLCQESDPTPECIAEGWRAVLGDLRALSERTGKPVVFTELGYDATPAAARAPWIGRPRGQRGPDARGEAVQVACYRAALDVLARERGWLRGAFLWKWFVGPAPGEDFRLDQPRLRALLRAYWD